MLNSNNQKHNSTTKRKLKQEVKVALTLKQNSEKII